jgi:uracil-DNA glycosylase
VFFTNAILCLKDGGAQSAVNRSWFQNCRVRFLRPLIELVGPCVVVGLGERAYRAVLGAYDLRTGTFSEAVRQERPVPLYPGVSAFAVYHWGARTQNINRSREDQAKDWQRIGRFLARTAG